LTRAAVELETSGKMKLEQVEPIYTSAEIPILRIGREALREKGTKKDGSWFFLTSRRAAIRFLARRIEERGKIEKRKGLSLKRGENSWTETSPRKIFMPRARSWKGIFWGKTITCDHWGVVS